MRLWRIGIETEEYKADSIEGKGGLYSSGRWHKKGHIVVYTASNISLALLETIVHVKSTGLPLNRYLIEINVPNDLWSKRHILDVNKLPAWDAVPSGQSSQEFGTQWLQDNESCLMEVPSVIVPFEKNILINPRHESLRKITSKNLGKFRYDPRIRNTGESA